MTMKDINSLSIIICLATLCISFTNAAWESYPLTIGYAPVIIKIGFYVPEDDIPSGTQPIDRIGSTEIYGFEPNAEEDESIIFVDTFDPNMEQVIVDESTEIIDPFSLSDPATDPDSSPPDLPSPDAAIENEIDSEDTSVNEAGEEGLTDSEPGDPETGDPGEPVPPDSNNLDSLFTNESAPTVPEQRPVGEISVTDPHYRPQTRIPDIAGRPVDVVALPVPFTRRRNPTRGEAVLHVRVITGYTAFKTPLDIWLASSSGGPRSHKRTECYFTMAPIEEMPELYHSGAPSRDDIMSGRTTDLFALGDWKFSVKNATGVGCISWVPRVERRRGWWGRKRSI